MAPRSARRVLQEASFQERGPPTCRLGIYSLPAPRLRRNRSELPTVRVQASEPLDDKLVPLLRPSGMQMRKPASLADQFAFAGCPCFGFCGWFDLRCFNLRCFNLSCVRVLRQRRFGHVRASRLRQSNSSQQQPHQGRKEFCVFHEPTIALALRMRCWFCDTFRSATPRIGWICQHRFQLVPAHGLQVPDALVSSTAFNMRGMCLGTSSTATCSTWFESRYEIRKKCWCRRILSIPTPIAGSTPKCLVTSFSTRTIGWNRRESPVCCRSIQRPKPCPT